VHEVGAFERKRKYRFQRSEFPNNQASIDRSNVQRTLRVRVLCAVMRRSTVKLTILCAFSYNTKEEHNIIIIMPKVLHANHVARAAFD